MHDGAPRTRRAVVRWAAVFGCWAVFGLFLYSHQYVIYTVREDAPFAWFPVFVLIFENVCLWAVFTPVILRLGERFPIRAGTWPRSVAVHLAAGAVFVSIGITCYWLVARQVRPERDDTLIDFFATYFHLDLQWYAAVLGVGHAIAYYRRYRDRELRASQLETQLVSAQLQSLKLQLQPHFLFNTLNTISTLVHEDPDVADRMVARLSELLRHSLEGADTQEVPLRDELQFLEPYLEIEQARFEDRLSVQRRIDPATLDALVPHLLFQPLVENAIRHGISQRAAPGTIEISTRRTNGLLHIEVNDDGVGRAGNARTAGAGVGLANTRARLTQLYGTEHRFEFALTDGEGARVRIAIPFRAAGDPPDVNGGRREGR
ncbi:MAG TPA: histidine kinase [Longimicrobiales bacterium]